MILTNRLFERRKPFKDAKTIYIFCEGAKTEFNYFSFFQEKDSRLKIEVYKLEDGEDNSPLGLLEIALRSLEGNNPKYTVLDGDEVWFVVDVDLDKLDSRSPQIVELLEESAKRKWNVAISNPCFEVWKYYHQNEDIPQFTDLNVCKNWKKHLGQAYKGGFDDRKHPIFIEKAAKYAESIYKEDNMTPVLTSTSVYKLANSILHLMKDKIDKILLNL